MGVVIAQLQKRSMESILIKCMTDSMYACMDMKRDGWKKQWMEGRSKEQCVDRWNNLL